MTMDRPTKTTCATSGASAPRDAAGVPKSTYKRRIDVFENNLSDGKV